MKDVYPPPMGNVHLSILQTVESRIPLLLSAYLWDKFSFEKSINAHKVGLERGYSFENTPSKRIRLFICTCNVNKVILKVPAQLSLIYLYLALWLFILVVFDIFVVSIKIHIQL